MLSLSPYFGVYPWRRGHHALLAHAGPKLVNPKVKSPVPLWDGDRSTSVGGQLSLGYEDRNRLNVEVMKLPKAQSDFRPRPRIALAASLVIGEHMLRVVNVHLDVRLNIARRIGQLHPVTMSAEDKTVIGSDFNTNPYSWAGPLPVVPDQTVAGTDQAAMLDDYMRAYGFDAPTTNSSATHNAVVRNFRLDMLYTRQLSAVDASVANGLELSDHVPLWIDVVRPRGP